eukprot:TRINITY_DN1588_c0_g1_i1.p1 TRINITY_DN1588_c0_g1~~TRINITY_DN1588_c0_g1_i1.p1  ORF type:complete len:158 (+),score=39.10 TRINITY_DN1588_c0_g1_i1:135-608(+)
MVVERTFVAVKPDGVQKCLVGEVIKRFEQKGYKMVAMKMIHPTMLQAERHYKEHTAKPFFHSLCEYFTSGPVVAMVWEGHDVVQGIRKLLGAASADRQGTIRGDFCIDVLRNVAHSSDSVEDGVREISMWFCANEIISWNKAAEAEEKDDDDWLYDT